MSVLCKRFEATPEYPRMVPYLVFAGLTFLQGQLGSGSEYWVYLLKTLIGAWMIWDLRPCLEEMRWKVSWEAVVVGVVVFVLWVGLDGHYPRLSKLDAGGGWDPNKHYGQGSLLAWFFICARIAGTALVVPPIEEIFYRSFLYRYMVNVNFRAMPFNRFHGLSFVVTSAIFGLVHPDRWVVGILCGMAYQGLTIYKNRLGDAMTAHGITNLLLGIWVAWKGAWNFW